MDRDASLWLLAVLTSAFLVWRLEVAHPRSRGLRVVCLLVVGLALYPLVRLAALAAVTWLYQQAPRPWADWLMPGRRALDLAYYHARARTFLTYGLMALWGLIVFLAGAVPVGTHARAWLRARWPRAAWGILALLGLLSAPLLWQQARFMAPHPVFYQGCRKVWGHRGHPQPPAIPENSIASFRRAFDLGAAGVEMDVAYLPERRTFIIHRPDREYPQRLTLEDVFQAVGHRGYFWLDIKTIRTLPPEQARQAAQDLALLVDAFGLRDRVIVESDHPENLMAFARQGLHTSYWIFNIDEDAFPRSWPRLLQALWRIRETYIQGGFSAISMDHRFYRPAVARALWGARVHLFTVNDPQRLQDLIRREQVRVVLTDEPLFDLDGCP